MIRILVVIKHVEVRDGLCTALQLSTSIESIDPVESLSGALERFRTAHPDVVIVDLEMPGGEGYETLRQLKYLFPETKVLALTAHDYPATWQRAVQAGAAGLIVKGLDWQEMIAAIQRAVHPGTAAGEPGEW